MQKVVVMGREGDGDGQSESFSGGELSNSAASNAESMVLESSSSFGSASSSASSSNLSSLKAQAEDAHGGANLQDIKVTLLSSDSFARYTDSFWALLCFLDSSDSSRSHPVFVCLENMRKRKGNDFNFRLICCVFR